MITKSPWILLRGNIYLFLMRLAAKGLFWPAVVGAVLIGVLLIMVFWAATITFVLMVLKFVAIVIISTLAIVFLFWILIDSIGS